MDITLVVIDYLQLMNCAEKKSSRSEEVRCISDGLKEIAMETNLPLIVLSQLSRTCEMIDHPDHRPLISDFVESGHLAQISDVILLLYREAYWRDNWKYNQMDDENVRYDAEVIVAKHSSVTGLPTVVHLTFNLVEGFRSLKR